MTPKAFVSTALPPPEIVKLLSKANLPKGAIEGWFDYPIPYPQIPKSRAQLLESAVDFETVMSFLFGIKEFFESICKMDLVVGCSKACNTCLAKAPLPSLMFSTESIFSGFKNRHLLRMLDPYHLRIGNTSEPTDQPDIIKILKMILTQTTFLDEKAQKKGRRHIVQIYTNYRPSSEDVLDQLIEIAKNNTRFQLTISLPVNKSDIVNNKFNLFVKKRPQIFFTSKKEWYMGLQTTLSNVTVYDIRKYHIYPIGRKLSSEILSSKSDLNGQHEQDNVMDYMYRGFGEIYVNPFATWYMVWGTIHQSPTLRSYTQINLKNYKFFYKIPWVEYSDNTTPKNWPSGTGYQRSVKEARLLQQQDTSPLQKVDIVY